MADDEPAGALLARYYDLDLGDDQPDLDLYLALARAAAGDRPAARLLELAAGSGRIAVPLAAAGHDVTAVDRDRHMLDRADARWRQLGSDERRGSLRTYEADVTQLRLTEDHFDLVILALGTLLMLPGRDAQQKALRSMATHLAKDGRAIVDIWLPAADDLALYDGRLVLDWTRRDPDGVSTVAKLSSARHDSATATASVQTFFDSWPTNGGALRRIARLDDLSFLTASELFAMAADAGLTASVVAGDYSLSTFGPGSDRLIVVLGLL